MSASGRLLYPRWVTLFFIQGAKLDDPEKLITGSGSQVRSIRLDGLATLKVLMSMRSFPQR